MWIRNVKFSEHFSLTSKNIRAYSRNLGHGWTFLCIFFFEKKAFWLLALPKQMLFLTIFNKKHFFKTKSTRLGVIVAPNKGPE